MKLKSRFAFFLLSFSILIIAGCLPNAKILWEGRGNYQLKQKEISFPYESKLQLILLPFQINEKSAKLIFDTGANTVLGVELAGNAKIRTKNFARVSDSQNQTKMARYGKVRTMENDQLKFEDFYALVTPFNSGLFQYMDASGLLGNELIKKSNWMIDPAAGEITLLPLEKSISLSSEYRKVPFWLDHQNRPRIGLMLGNGEIMELLVDFGSNAGISISKKALLKYWGEESEAVCVMEGYQTGLHGARIRKIEYHLVENLALGNHPSSHPVLLTVKNGIRSKIGMDFFNNYVTILDFKEEIIYLKPLSEKWHTNEIPSFSVVPEGKDLVVGTRNECLESSGLRLGDKVLRINELDCEDADFERLRQALDIINEEKELEVEYQKTDGSIHTEKLAPKMYK